MIYNLEKLTDSKKRLEELKYINSISISETQNNDLKDIYLSIDENLKTGNILFAGYISGDTGLGFSFNIKILIFLVQEMKLTLVLILTQKKFFLEYLTIKIFLMSPD